MRLQFLLALLAAFSLPVCSRMPGKDGRSSASPDSGVEAVETPDPAEEEAVLVRAVPVKIEDIERRLEVTANVISLDVVDLMPERAEPVQEVLVEEGAQVQKGQPLAVLRNDVCKMALSEAQVKLEEARNNWEKTKRDYKRNQTLFEGENGQRLISDKELEQSHQDMIAAETAFKAAQVALDRAEWDLGHCTLRAPIAGTIAVRDVSEGDMTAIGQRAFQIVDQTSPRAVFYRPQRELADLKPGQPLTATSEALPGVEIPGRIERISPTVDPQSGTVKVTARLEPEGVKIPIGILVRIVVVLARHPDAILIPKRALLYEGRNPYCFLVRDGRAEMLTIHPGFENPDYLEAIPGENGPRRDDQVVIVGGDRLAEGDLVELAKE